MAGINKPVTRSLSLSKLSSKSGGSMGKGASGNPKPKTTLRKSTKLTNTPRTPKAMYNAKTRAI